MHTEYLRTFLSLAETGSFSRCAQSMLVAQSTVSKRIQELEVELSQTLFERGRGGVRLTAAGRALTEYAEQIVNTEERAMRRLRRADTFAGNLVLGSVYAYFDVYLGGMLKAFLERRPDISVEVRLGHTARMLAEVRRAAVDIAFTHHPLEHPELICELVEEDDVILVTDAGNGEHRAGVPYEKVRELPFVSSNFLYESTRSWLFPAGMQFQLEMDVAKHAIPFLKNSKWYTLSARRLVEGELKSGALLEIPIVNAKLPPVRYYMIRRKDGAARAEVKAWLEMLNS